jgi:hypothetical protein
MKTITIILILCAGQAFAQNPEPVQPTIGVVAVIHERDSSGVSLQLANQLTKSIGEDKSGALFLKSETIQLHTERATNGALVEIAHGRGLNYVAVVDYQPGPQSAGAFTVELARSSASKIVEKTVLIMGVLVAGTQRLGAQISAIASTCISGIGALVRKNVLIRVLLDLCVKPATGKSDYILGKADMRSTNDLGLDRWETSLPVGKTILKIMKSGFQDAQVDIDVPWSNEEYVIKKIVEMRQ